MAATEIQTILILLSLSIIIVSGGQTQTQTLPSPDSENTLFQAICQGKETLTKVQFYVQDLLAGANPTVYEVARSSITGNSPTTFGQVRVLDDKLTAEAAYDSEEIGRAQGMITSADLETSAIAMNLNFVFTSGQYNGSSISIVGRNEIMKAERELPVVGGTGVFRFTRGYAVTKTHSYDVENSYGVLQYTLYVTTTTTAAQSDNTLGLGYGSAAAHVI